MLKKLTILILILILLTFTLYGCYDSTSIEEYAYVIAIGIDEGKENAIKLTLQFALSDSSSESSSSQSNKSSIITVECCSIDNGISIVNSYISKIINLSHCQIIAISEIIAEKGIEKYIHTLINNVEMRTDCNLLITKCTAKNYIKNSTPILTNLSARYYEVLLNSESYTGYTVKAPILELSSSAHNFFGQHVTILAGLNSQKYNTKNNNINLIDKSIELKPSETPITGNTKSQIIGLAILNKMKLIGELNSIESICYLILTNQLDRCIISIPSPFNSDESIDLLFKINNSSKNKVKIINNTPYITCNIELKASIHSFSGNIDYAVAENINIIEEYASSYMKAKISDFLYKTAKVYNSDIAGFGYYLTPKYTTIDELEKTHWTNNYKNAFFNVNVNTTIKATSLFATN